MPERDARMRLHVSRAASLGRLSGRAVDKVAAGPEHAHERSDVTMDRALRASVLPILLRLPWLAPARMASPVFATFLSCAAQQEPPPPPPPPPPMIAVSNDCYKVVSCQSGKSRLRLERVTSAPTTDVPLTASVSDADGVRFAPGELELQKALSPTPQDIDLDIDRPCNANYVDIQIWAKAGDRRFTARVDRRCD